MSMSRAAARMRARVSPTMPLMATRISRKSAQQIGIKAVTQRALRNQVRVGGLHAHGRDVAERNRVHELRKSGPRNA